MFEHIRKGASAAPNHPKPIPPLITESLRACDPELRQVLMGNVVLTGGGSLFAGFADRLNSELARSFQHVRIFCYLVMFVNSSLVTGQNSCTGEYRRAAIWRMAGR
jgi:actin-related protein